MAKKKTSKESVDKNVIAKQKAEELFSDILTEIAPKKVEAKKVEPKPTVQELNSTSWLEEQVQALSEQVETLEQKLADKTLEYQKLLASKNSAPQVDSNIVNGIKLIFDELRNNYEGNNVTRTRYTDAKIKILLDKFVRLFPFLNDDIY